MSRNAFSSLSSVFLEKKGEKKMWGVVVKLSAKLLCRKNLKQRPRDKERNESVT